MEGGAETKKGYLASIWQWIRARAAAAAEKAAENLFLLIIVAVVSGGGTILATAKRALDHQWVLVGIAAGLFVLSIAGITLAVIKKVRVERRRLQQQIDALNDELRTAETELEQDRQGSEAVRTLLYSMLEAIQEEIATEYHWELDALVERGVLGAVRGLLTRSPEEDVRLSVLVPRDGDKRWRMRWAAGHSVQGVRNYDREIDKTIAGKAYREGSFIASNNVKTDPRFKFEPNPRATRDYTSQMIVPIRIGDESALPSHREEHRVRARRGCRGTAPVTLATGWTVSSSKRSGMGLAPFQLAWTDTGAGSNTPGYSRKIASTRGLPFKVT